ncbi:putative powdery mildew resistance protein, RPW8 [Lupinus albus]|uniref:Putative powdery mildew resistance protein, RPW8 n=1 Tax=Lupinus albus TaxID=3870 RepID=A0A6A4QLK3_LUPAL|nr:putative powdery mildew resistance protein, RPW8 [Lupinus albus]
MAENLFIGGAVGAVMQEVLKTAIETIDKGRDFRPTLENNIDILEALSPLVEDIKQYSKVLDRSTSQVEKLENEIQVGKELVKKCSKFGWWRFLSFPYYRDKLHARDSKLVRLLSVDMQGQMVRDTMEILVKVREILEILCRECVGFGKHEKLLRGLSGVPEKPEFIVGLDENFKKLKILCCCC